MCGSQVPVYKKSDAMISELFPKLLLVLIFHSTNRVMEGGHGGDDKAEAIVALLLGAPGNRRA